MLRSAWSSFSPSLLSSSTSSMPQGCHTHSIKIDEYLFFDKILHTDMIEDINRFYLHFFLTWCDNIHSLGWKHHLLLPLRSLFLSYFLFPISCFLFLISFFQGWCGNVHSLGWEHDPANRPRFQHLLHGLLLHQGERLFNSQWILVATTAMDLFRSFFLHLNFSSSSSFYIASSY